MSARAAFSLGVRRCAPLALGAVPFGAAAGLSAVGVGMSAVDASTMSLVVFAGASQLAVLDLARSGAPAAVIIVLGVVINLRFAMYSAALADWARPRRLSGRLTMAYLLTDQAFALTSLRRTEADRPPHLVWFYAGAALTLWVAWQIGTVLGAVLGAELPASAGLDFVAPLAFVALAIMAIRDRADLATALVAVAAYALLSGTPYGLALLPAVGIALVAGHMVSRRAA